MRKLVLLSLMLCLPAISQAEEKTATITVHGEAVTKVAPDQVTLPITIREENVDVKAAKQKHDKKLNALLNLAEKTGIEKNNIRTSYTAINPQYDYGQGEPRFRNYEVQTTLDFTLRDTTKLAEFMNGVLDLGVTTMGNVTFSLHDEDTVKQDTLAKAIENAHAKAERMTSAARVTLDKPLAIEDSEPQIIRPFWPRPMMRAGVAMLATAPAQAPDLPSGMIEIHQNVTVTYQMK